jgi:type II secretory pathway predicted ATPase ExeA
MMYLDFFHLKEKPFNVTPDPHFLYMSPSHQESFANLLYGVRERKGFIAITGEVGTGKTTLLHNLLQNLDEEIRTVFVFHTGIEFTDLLEMIHHELNIPFESNSRAALLQTLNKYLIQQLGEGRNVALIIDEAQNLSPEILENLRLLSNLETAKDKLLQIVLVGQPELANKLDLPQLRQLKQRITVQGNIDALTAVETRSYILHRLAVAGADAASRPILSDEAIDMIQHASGGVPRRINVICDNALLIAYADGAPVVQARHVRETLRDRERSVRQERATDQLTPLPDPDLTRSGNRSGMRTVGIILGAAALVTMLYGAYRLGDLRSFGNEDQLNPAVLRSGLADGGLAGSVAATISGEQETVSPAPLPSEAVTGGNRFTNTGDLDSAGLPKATEQESSSVPAGHTVDSEPVQARAAAAGNSNRNVYPDSPLPAELDSPTEQSINPLQRQFWAAATYSQVREVVGRCTRLTYIVKPSDHFIGIISRFTGRQDALVIDAIESMNPHIKDYDHIEPGWVLYLPDFGS